MNRRMDWYFSSYSGNTWGVGKVRYLWVFLWHHNSIKYQWLLIWHTTLLFTPLLNEQFKCTDLITLHCCLSIFFLSSAMTLCSSVILSSYLTVVCSNLSSPSRWILNLSLWKNIAGIFNFFTYICPSIWLLCQIYKVRISLTQPECIKSGLKL